MADGSKLAQQTLDFPTGNTASRPGSPVIGDVRFNTTTDCLENYTSGGWLKVSIPIPNVTSISGVIYAGSASTITLSGTQFGTTQGVVNFVAGETSYNVNATPSNPTTVSAAVPAGVYGNAGGSSVAIKFTNGDGGISNTTTLTISGVPTGGTIVTSGGYRYHTFTGSSNFVVPSSYAGPSTVEYLIVAGGGGGGNANANDGGASGGGGAGGMRTGTTSMSANTTYSVTVGAGASGINPSGASDPGNNGSDSSIFSITSTGGGGGGGNASVTSGRPGGSGGGGNNGAPGQSGSGTPGQGNPGGTGAPSPGGGGGAGAAGSPGTSGSGAAGGSGSNANSTWASATSAGASGYYAGGGGAGGASG